MISIIDYGAGNVESVRKAFEYIGCECAVTSDAERILSSDGAVLPGVGSFGDCMQQLERTGLIPVVKEFAQSGKPFLGICLGLQLLFEESEESAGVSGLSFFPGRVVRFPADNGLKIPHIGWNSIKLNEGCPLFEGLSEDTYVYFVHSYYLKSARADIVAATTEYGCEFHSAVWSGNVFATQFHPEKSGSAGLRMLRNFASLCAGGAD